MNDRIVNISNVITEEEEKYHEFSRKKIIVDFLNERGKGKREEYLEEARTAKDVNSFLNYSKVKKNAIHIDSLNRTWKNRLLWNFIMALIGAGAFFAIPNLGKVFIDSFSLNASVIGTLNFYLLGAIEIGLFSYVNQKKFYYTKKELSHLEEMKADINKANDILAEIIAYKEKEFENSRERSKIKYQTTIFHNHNRNIDMVYEKNQYVKDANARIEKRAEETVKNMGHKTPLGNIRLDEIYSYPKTELTRKQKYKRMVRNVGKWFQEAFEDPEYETRRRK